MAREPQLLMCHGHAVNNSGFGHVSWTGGSTRESQVVRVITGFVQPAEDPGYRSIPQVVTGNVETVVYRHSAEGLPLRADVYHPTEKQAAMHNSWTIGRKLPSELHRPV